MLQKPALLEITMEGRCGHAAAVPARLHRRRGAQLGILLAAAALGGATWLWHRRRAMPDA